MNNQIFFPVNPEDFISQVKEAFKTLITEIPAKEPPQPFVAPLLTQKEILKLFSITKPTLGEWELNNFLKPKAVGGKVFYFRKDIDEFLQTLYEQSVLKYKAKGKN